jgi:hypothetical protein
MNVFAQYIKRLLAGDPVTMTAPVMQSNLSGDCISNPAPANGLAVTPSDDTEFEYPSWVCAVVGGTFYVDCWKSGTNIPIYLNAGQCSNYPVKRVYSTGLGSGVSLTRHW